MIKVEGVTKVYRLYNNKNDRLKEALLGFTGRSYHHNFHALQNVSLEVGKGEVVGIVGRNGSGKSTLLKIITGVLTPTFGTVSVNGRISALIELGAGFNPEYTGVENIRQLGTIYGKSRAEVDERLDHILSFADIGEYARQPVKIYSSGMFARLAFSMAVGFDPDILIVDEALSVGDSAFQRKCFARMEEIRADGKTILFVSHSEMAIVGLCQRAILIDHGEKLLEGSPKGVVSRYLKLINMKPQDGDKYREILRNEGTVAEPEGHAPSVSSSETVAGEKMDAIGGGIGAVFGRRHAGDDDEAFYASEFVSKSRVEYEPRGAVIRNVRMTTLSGREVNHLVHNHRYVYSYEVEALEDIENVRTGFMIKTQHGAQIGGANYPSMADVIPRLRKGAVMLMRWEFDCILEEGVYFTNSGVRLFSGEGLSAHRILDAHMFRVLPRSGGNVSGIVDFNVKGEMMEISVTSRHGDERRVEKGEV